MLDMISDGFRQAKDRIRGKTVLSAENIDEALNDIRKSLLEADVEYGVVRKFLEDVKTQALGKEVSLRAGTGSDKMRIGAGEHFVQICHEALVKIMGESDSTLDLPKNRPASIMMVGLQGSGKTTTTGKLSKYLVRKHHRKPLLVAADIYRPAAVEQLRVLGAKLGAPVYHAVGQSAVDICKGAASKAMELGCDVILYDTAGRLTIDEQLMKELDDIKAAVRPDHIFFVCDAMMGQDAVTTAKSFHERLDVSGVIMTKLDGDARGGAALSIREVVGRPIKFLGMGEDLERLEEFRPEGLASRILGMGDIVGLMEDFQRVAKKDQEEDALRMLQGQFTYLDFYEQISMIQNMGPLKDIMAKLPIQGLIPKDFNFDERQFMRIKAIIDSMTKQERLLIKPMNDSRIRRVAKGSGQSTREIQDLIKKFQMMRQMMGNMGKNMGLLGKIPGMGSLNQLNQMRKMAQNLGSGGSPFDPNALGGFGGLGGDHGLGGLGGPALLKRSESDREKQRKMRKDAKKARKKNRR
jgi:signal recognition particle subunit SRP54